MHRARPTQLFIIALSALLVSPQLGLAQSTDDASTGVSAPGPSSVTDGSAVAADGTSARGPSEQELESARALFGEGLELLEEERWAEAAERFQRVLSVKFSPVVAYNLAFSLSRMGRLIEAADLLRPIARDMDGDRDARLAASALLDEIDPKIASITVHLSGATEGVTLFLDDRALPTEHLGRPLRVDPGEVAVRVERDGEVVASRSVMVGGEHGTRVGVTLEVPPREVPEPAAVARAQVASGSAGPIGAPRDEASEGVTGQWWFWTLSGGVALAAAVVVVALAAGGSTEQAAPVEGDIGSGVLRGPVMAP